MASVSGDGGRGTGTGTGTSQALDVSRTVQSSDLFTPYREPRVTLPTIGSFCQRVLPLGGKYWGGSLTEYGGIGALAFSGRQRVRDLEVTRSHRHYRSGLSKYLTDVQSHRRTRLHLSECRLNDQILPAPPHADVSKLNWQRSDPWPDSQAYGTHRSIFEVFPTVKQGQPSHEQAESHRNSTGSDAKPLRKTTQKALVDLSQKLYDRTLYQDSYLNYPGQRVGPSAPAHETQADEDGETEDGGESDQGEKSPETDGSEDETDGEQDEASPAYASAGETPPNLDVGAEGRRSNPGPQTVNSATTRPPDGDDGGPQSMEETVRRFRVAPNRQMLGVGPCWPPGASYVVDAIHGAQLVERPDITRPTPVHHDRSPARPAGEAGLKMGQRLLSARSRLVAKRAADVTSEDQTAVGFGLPPARTSKDEFLRRRMRDRDDDHVQQQPSNQDGEEKAAPTNHGPQIARPLGDDSQREGFKLPTVATDPKADRRPLDPPGVSRASLVLPPAPLADCLPTTGNRIPHRLGLRYKTEAHKRYHLMYPDDIPDLRTNCKDGKKYFFFNFHSSVFRG